MKEAVWVKFEGSQACRVSLDESVKTVGELIEVAVADLQIPFPRRKLALHETYNGPAVLDEIPWRTLSGGYSVKTAFCLRLVLIRCQYEVRNAMNSVISCDELDMHLDSTVQELISNITGYNITRVMSSGKELTGDTPLSSVHSKIELLAPTHPVDFPFQISDALGRVLKDDEKVRLDPTLTVKELVERVVKYYDYRKDYLVKKKEVVLENSQELSALGPGVIDLIALKHPVNIQFKIFDALGRVLKDDERVNIDPTLTVNDLVERIVKYYDYGKEYLVTKSESVLEYSQELWKLGPGVLHLVALKYETVDLKVQENNQLRHYIAVGKKFENDPIVANIYQRITAKTEEIKYDSPRSVPFMFFDASSGMGKTQTAFALEQHCLKKGRKFIYLLAENADQAVYKPFFVRSTTFLKCAEEDMRRNSFTTNDHVSAAELSFQLGECYTFALLKALLTDEVYHPRVVQRYEVFRLLSELQQKPIIFIDEFLPLKTGEEGNELLIRFLLNVFLSLKLPVILSSRNSSGMCLVDRKKGSRGDARLWCILVSRFPGFKSDLPSPFGKILENSRPMLSSLLVQVLGNGEFTLKAFEDACKSIHDHLWRMKSDPDSYMCGQLVMLYPFQCEISADQYEGSRICDGHFANVLESTPIEINEDSGNLLINNYQFRLFNVGYLKPSQDVLLYLCLMGGKDHSAFYKESPECRIPMIHQYNCCLDTLKTISNDNDKDGMNMSFELLIPAAIVSASHKGGFSGIEFHSFLGEILYELGLHVTSMPTPPGIQTLMRMKIPFLAPVDQRWPSYLKAFGLELGHPTLNKHKDRNEITLHESLACRCINNKRKLLLCKCEKSVELGISFEWEHGTSVSSETMENICDRVPKSSKIHVVVSNSFRKFYRIRDKGTDFAFYLLQVADNAASFVTVKGLPVSESPKCLVLLIPLGNQSLSSTNNSVKRKRVN